jgi:4-amino-4-deoxy-L-arabinose transferase-like glycosyltransferase
VKQNKASKNLPWLLIFLVALILRLVPVIAFRDLGIGLDDMYQYDMLARSIASGNGFRWYAEEDLPLVTSYLDLELEEQGYDPRGILTSFRPPLYPAFLAVIYLFTGITARRFFIARLVQAFLASTLIPLTYVLARRLFPETRKIATLASWMIALYPMLVIYPLSLATENLFFVLLTSAVLALVIASQAPMEPVGQIPRKGFIECVIQNRWFLAAGVLLGLAALTRSVSLALAFLSIIWIWFVVKKKKQALLVLLMVILVTVPWMMRNSLLHHRLVGVESALGYDLYVGYHPEAWEFIQADPARFPYLILRRAGYFFGLERRALTYFYSNNFFGHISNPLLMTMAVLFCLPFVIVSLSAVLGLVLTKWNNGTSLLLLIMGGYIVPHLLIIAEDRFHLALLPFFAILSAVFWSQGFHFVKKRWMTPAGRWMLAIASVTMLLLITNWTLELVRDADKLMLLFGPSGNQTYFPY